MSESKAFRNNKPPHFQNTTIIWWCDISKKWEEFLSCIIYKCQTSEIICSPIACPMWDLSHHSIVLSNGHIMLCFLCFITEPLDRKTKQPKDHQNTDVNLCCYLCDSDITYKDISGEKVIWSWEQLRDWDCFSKSKSKTQDWIFEELPLKIRWCISPETL